MGWPDERTLENPFGNSPVTSGISGAVTMPSASEMRKRLNAPDIEAQRREIIRLMHAAKPSSDGTTTFVFKGALHPHVQNELRCKGFQLKPSSGVQHNEAYDQTEVTF